MSRAFVKEDRPEDPPQAPARAPLLEGQPNYVTPRGLRLLHEEKQGLENELAGESDPARLGVLRARLADLILRVAGARVIDLSGESKKDVRFGATVRVLTAGEESVFTLVGVDEADAASRRISFFSPVGQALVGRKAGDVVALMLEEGTEEATMKVLSIRYEAE